MKQHLPFLLLCSITIQVWAQPNAQPSFVSPEVSADGKATFRLWAPKAREKRRKYAACFKAIVLKAGAINV